DVAPFSCPPPVGSKIRRSAMTTTRLILAALLTSLALALPARAAESIAVRAVLIMASNKKAPADPKLPEFDAGLQRNSPDTSFRLVRDGSANLADGGRATIALGPGNTLEVEAKKTAEGIHLKLRCDKLGIDGTFVQAAGVPIVFGRRSGDDSE